MSQRYDRQRAQKEYKNVERSTKQMQSSRYTSYKNMLNKSWDFPTFPKITVVVTQVKYKVSILERHITKQLCILAFCMWTKIQSHSVQSPTVEVMTQLQYGHICHQYLNTFGTITRKSIPFISYRTVLPHSTDKRRIFTCFVRNCIKKVLRVVVPGTFQRQDMARVQRMGLEVS